MDRHGFGSSTRAVENRTRPKKCCQVIYGAPTTLQGYGIDQTRVIFFVEDITSPCNYEQLLFYDYCITIAEVKMKLRLHAPGLGRLIQPRHDRRSNSSAYPSKHLTFMRPRINVNATSLRCIDVGETLP